MSRGPETWSASILVSAPAQSIAGGTDEIRRNILGERFLGLPREPNPGKDQPCRENGNQSPDDANLEAMATW